jgi:hypothetical protein
MLGIFHEDTPSFAEKDREFYQGRVTTKGEGGKIRGHFKVLKTGNCPRQRGRDNPTGQAWKPVRWN